MVAPVSPIEEALVAISDGRCLSPSSRSILSFSASALRSCTDVGHAAARVLELWKGNTPEPGPTGVRRNGKTGKIVWERVAMFVEHVDIIRAVGWREDGRLLASCDLGGTVKLWARCQMLTATVTLPGRGSWYLASTENGDRDWRMGLRGDSALDFR
eukprot:1031084-Rhodomonas_salina.7